MANKAQENFSDADHKVLKSISVTKIILPILIGVAVVLYLLWRKFDPADFGKIDWTTHTFIWIGVALLLLIIRHLGYATRLYILADGEFTFLKCVELIFIWEFSSAVSPTSVGGSAVALLILSKEKLSGAKTTTIVIYTVVLDTLFFVVSIPILYMFFGSSIIRPGLTGLSDLDKWGMYFAGAYVLMVIYGSFFYYGLFINPVQIKRTLAGITKIRFLKKYRRRAITLGNDLIMVSKEMKHRSWKFHLSAFLATAVAWSFRFLVLNALIFAFVPEIPSNFLTQFAIYARLKVMFVIIAFSPTPGGSGFIEILFSGFLSDYISNSTAALVIAFVWRLMAYYSYLIAGAIIIPNWLRKILSRSSK